MNVLSGCSGIGGLDLGFKAEGFRTVCYIESEPFPQSVLLERMRDGLLDVAPIWNDFKTFDGKPWRGVVDCFIAGIPCQPHSKAGRRTGKEDDRNLWPDMLRITREVEPSIVVLENVSGLFTGPEAYGLTVVGQLQDLGYIVFKRTLSAREVGAPHLRERIFVIGILASDHIGFGRVDWECKEFSEEAGESSQCGIDTRFDFESSDSFSERRGGRSYGDSYLEEREDDKNIRPYGVGVRGETEGFSKDSQAHVKPSDSERERIQRDSEESVFRLPTFEAFENVRSVEELFGRPDIPEPLVRGGDDGTANRLDRVKAVGNAVVPQVARQIAQEIKKIIG